jgi:lysozyme family protein
MTETEKIIQEINGFFKVTGDEELTIQKCASELELLRTVKEEYKRRLLDKIPKYRALPSETLIPDMFLQALRSRESELEAESAT